MGIPQSKNGVLRRFLPAPFDKGASRGFAALHFKLQFILPPIGREVQWESLKK